MSRTLLYDTRDEVECSYPTGKEDRSIGVSVYKDSPTLVCVTREQPYVGTVGLGESISVACNRSDSSYEQVSKQVIESISVAHDLLAAHCRRLANTLIEQADRLEEIAAILASDEPGIDVSDWLRATDYARPMPGLTSQSRIQDVRGEGRGRSYQVRPVTVKATRRKDTGRTSKDEEFDALNEV